MTKESLTTNSRTQIKSLVELLQSNFVKQLEAASNAVGFNDNFVSINWLRDEGQHGGGTRYTIGDSTVFNRASVNVSQIYYDDLPEKPLDSATALSTIIHPDNPHAPSMHMHISWTQLKSGHGYWRMMADLNPSIINPNDTSQFIQCLKTASQNLYEQATTQGDRYFYIPALERHRGVCHFYLENFNSGNAESDLKLAQTLAEAVIDGYTTILKKALINNPQPTPDDYSQQLAYHTLYFLQVLTLDRGTTSGLLVHNQNDVGTLGSLPANIDKALLTSWKKKVKPPQSELLASLINVLPDKTPCPITDETKQKLANVVRNFYTENPEAIKLQASADIIPSTVENHR
ncbi:MAG: coproporphyrinogen III oxidase [Gammaproteobacteria bacterium]|nr:coproporphyrinogen III oxidase [Gammaproteobacteria bacterium]